MTATGWLSTSSQYVFLGQNTPPYTTPWLESSTLPAYICGASVICLAVQIVRAKTHTPHRPAYAYQLSRAVGTFMLLGLALLRAMRTSDHGSLSWAITFAYASLLAVLTVIGGPGCALPASGHLFAIEIAAWAVYAYRDLLPLGTFTMEPQDIAEGPFLWVKVFLLTFVAVILPLTASREYRPLKPEAGRQPAPEQVASIFSILSFKFMNKLVWLAYSTEGHLPYDKLPVLPDTDEAENLRDISYPHIDTFSGAKDGHIFWGLLRVFRFQYIISGLTLTVNGFAAYISPAAINRLLNYLEMGGEGAVVRPWVWILLLFIGPILSSVLLQSYFFNTMRVFIRGQAIITTIVFEHALRIRLKAEVQKPAIATAEAEGSETSGDDTVFDGSGSSSPNTPSSKPAVVKPEVSNQNMVGKINNLVTSDLANIADGRDFMVLFTDTPIQLMVAIWFLYAVLGVSAFAGVAVMVILAPLPTWVAKRMSGVSEKKMKTTDVRVEVVSQTMNVLRMIKLFGWEKSTASKLGVARDEELVYVKQREVLHVVELMINTLIPVLTMIVTYATYTLVFKEELTASKVFSSMTVFDMLRWQMRWIVSILTRTIQAKVSLDRVNDFLHSTDLLDRFDEDEPGSLGFGVPDATAIGFTAGAAFSWVKDLDDGTTTPSRRAFRLRFEDDLWFKKGALNLVVGPTGCGKSSLLMSLLGEMHFVSELPGAAFNLPREGGLAYASQESWVQNLTIRENILFGAPYNEERYKKVIHQCALERDLSLFKAGDRTEVGEKGLTLSGGQKARVTLARAIYSKAAILLLDDILAALDVHSARWIADKCLSGDLVKGRTVIMVTHNVAMCAPISQHMVVLGTDGRVSSQGSVSEALFMDESLAMEVAEEDELLEKDDEVVDAPDLGEPAAEEDSGKLVLAEEVEVGHVSWPAFAIYLTAMSSTPVLYWAALVSLATLADISSILQTKWLGLWGQQYDTHPASEVDVPYYIGFYSILMVLNLLFSSGFFMYLLLGSLRASRTLHVNLIQAIMGTTLRWLDITPVSRVLARCTQDITSVDGPVFTELSDLITLSSSMLWKLLAVVLATPLVIVPALVVACCGAATGQFYINAQLVAKREASNAKSPILSQFGASIVGLTSIRAYGAEGPFKAEMLKRIDHHSRPARLLYDLNRWIAIRMDCLGALFASGLASYLIYGMKESPRASDIGFSLNMAIGFSAMIIWLVRTWNEFEIAGNSLERLKGFMDIEQEPKGTAQGAPPAYWPASGSLRVKNLSARYSKDGPKILHNVSFEIKSGERVGVVGRTGSGKSSLTLSLLRCILTEGDVYYDGLQTSTINLDALRKAITIIPQVPELLSGSLRSNLDPFEEHTDATLNDALRSAGLFSLQAEMSEDTRITLDSSVSSGGGNLSVGQRQILALARAIVRRSMLLILDEATSAIDYKTDTVIQESLRHELPKDVTLITVAHRLQTIMDADKIMVLDAGRIVEFDSPRELLKNKKGLLRALVDESGDREQLLAMVQAK